MIGRLITDFRQLHHALTVYYRKRARAKLTPEQEVERLIAHYDREQKAWRRAGRRR